MTEWSPEKLAEYDEKHRLRCLEYYWENREQERGRQREAYSRTAKRSNGRNRKDGESKAVVEHTPMGPCDICNDKWSDHGLCTLIWEVRERLNARS